MEERKFIQIIQFDNDLVVFVEGSDDQQRQGRKGCEGLCGIQTASSVQPAGGILRKGVLYCVPEKLYFKRMCRGIYKVSEGISEVSGVLLP